jgi:peroxiredoxin
MISRLFLVLASFAASATAFALTAGQSAPEFTLTDLSGRVHSLQEYRGKVVVLEWTNPECPFVVKHYGSGNMPSLQKQAVAEGVVWLTLNSNRPGSQGSYDDAAAQAWLKSQGAAPSAYLRDPEGKVGKAYDAKVTPHLYVINPEGKLAYVGAIDSIRSAKAEDVAKAENYVVAALKAVKAGQPVAKAQTSPYGCGIKY